MQPTQPSQGAPQASQRSMTEYIQSIPNHTNEAYQQLLAQMQKERVQRAQDNSRSRVQTQSQSQPQSQIQFKRNSYPKKDKGNPFGR